MRWFILVVLLGSCLAQVIPGSSPSAPSPRPRTVIGSLQPSTGGTDGTPIFAVSRNRSVRSIVGPLTVTGPVNNVVNTVYVGGATYPLSAAGVQSAINTACNGSVLGAVIVPTATIALNMTGLSVPNNCDIGGVGQAATKLTLTSNATTTHFVNQASSPSNIRIHDMTLDGGGGTSVSEGCIGMNLTTSPTDITIERVTCQNVGATGINVTGSPANPGDHVEILSSKIINAGMICPGSSCARAGQIYGILISNNSHAAAINNEVTGGGITAGIAAFSAINVSSGRPIVDIQVVANRVHDFPTSSNTTGGGIDVGRARQVVVSGNTLYNIINGACVIFEAVWGGTMSTNSCSVADTVLTGGPLVIMTPDTTQAGEVASQDISIVSNTIADNSAVATTNSEITVNGAQRNITITGNSISYLNQPTSGSYGIYLQLGTADANISGSNQNFCGTITVEGNTIIGRQGSRGAVMNGIGVQQVSTACTVDQIVVANNAIKGASNGITIFSAAASNGITHLFVYDNAVEGNRVGVSTDGKTYTSAFFGNNNLPNGSGIQTGIRHSWRIGGRIQN